MYRLSSYKEHRQRLDKSRRRSGLAQGKKTVSKLQKFGGSFVDFLGEYILGLPFKELRALEKKSPKPLTPPPLPPQQFDNTLEGQYQRYFQTPEFNNVFGAGSRGKGAPQDASAMQELGNQLRAPGTDTNIASMYASQSALGRVNQDEIQDYFSDSNLPGNVKKEGAELSALQQWAKANPMLAQREYLKAEQRRANEIGNERERVQLDDPMGREAYNLIKKQLLNKAAAK